MLSNPQITYIIRSLQSNVAYKLLFVNLTAMVIPRIYIDLRRNRYAGQETAFYELSSLLINYVLPGSLALAVASVLKKFKNPFRVDTLGWASNQHIRMFSEIYRRSVQENSKIETLEQFIKNTLTRLEGIDALNGKSTRLSSTISQQEAKRIYKLFFQQKPKADDVRAIGKTIGGRLGTFDRVTLRNGKNSVTLNPEKLIQYLHDMGTQFQKAHTLPTANIIKNNVEIIAKKLQATNHAKTLISLSVVSALGFSAQFVNRWITFLQTGKKEFVGYKDFGKEAQKKANKVKTSFDHTFKTMPQHIASLSPHPTVSFMPPLKTASKELYFKGMESSQFLPSAEQLKYTIYPVGILGKLLASRDWSEFRETFTKASFAYFNFLFVPNLIENLVAHGLGRQDIFNTPKVLQQPRSGNWFTNIKEQFQHINRSTIRSYQDIELYAERVGQNWANLSDSSLQTNLKALLRHPDAVIAKTRQLSNTQKTQMLSEVVKKELNGLKNTATLSGILYSCLTLGIGLNLLNVYLTNKKRLPKPPEGITSQAVAASGKPYSAPAFPSPYQSGKMASQYQYFSPNPLSIPLK